METEDSETTESKKAKRATFDVQNGEEGGGSKHKVEKRWSMNAKKFSVEDPKQANKGEGSQGKKEKIDPLSEEGNKPHGKDLSRSSRTSRSSQKKQLDKDEKVSGSKGAVEFPEKMVSEEDFGQKELQASKKDEEEFRERKGSWAEDIIEEEVPESKEEEEEEEGGGMKGLIGRSKAAKEKMAAKEIAEASKIIRRRKKKTGTKEEGKDAKKKEKKCKPIKQKEPVEEEVIGEEGKATEDAEKQMEEEKPTEGVETGLKEEGKPTEGVEVSLKEEEKSAEAEKQMEEEKLPEAVEKQLEEDKLTEVVEKPKEEEKPPEPAQPTAPVPEEGVAEIDEEEEEEVEEETKTEKAKSIEVVEEICPLPDELPQEFEQRKKALEEVEKPEIEEELQSETEEAKEEDKIIELSEMEKTKEEIKRKIHSLRSSYRAIAHKNNEISEENRLPKKMFRLDDRIYQEIKGRTDSKVELAQKMREYNTAELQVLMEKIQKFYFEEVDVPHIVVKDLCHTCQTHTIRLRKLTQQFKDLMEQNLDMMITESKDLQFHYKLEHEEEDSDEKKIKRTYVRDIIGDYENKIHLYKTDIVHAIRRLEKMLENRYIREKEWDQLLKMKITSSYVAPEDLEALRIAKETRGDFQLQNAANYLGEQLTMAERRQRIIDLKQNTRKPIVEFNEKVFAAKKLKKDVLEACRAIIISLLAVQKQLPKPLRRTIPQIYEIDLEEEPDRMMSISEADIEMAEKAQCQANNLLDFREKMIQDKAKKSGLSSPRGSRIDTRIGRKTRHGHEKDEDVELVDAYIPLITEQDKLFEELTEKIDNFRYLISSLFKEKLKLELETKLREIYKITLSQELAIASEFAAQEQAINERLMAQRAECAGAKAKMERAKKKFNKSKDEQRVVEKEIDSVGKEVAAVIGDKGKFTEYLWKVYKRKLKKEADEDEAGSSSSRSEDSSDSTSQDTSSDLYKLPRQKLDINTCPDNLDPNIYAKVCHLREKRNRIELQLDAHKKLVDQAAREFREIEEVYLRFEGRLTNIGEEIKQLRIQRQKRINNLRVMLILRADQINCIDNDEAATVKGNIFRKLEKTFPAVENILIFPRDGTDKLKLRPAEIQKQTKAEKIRFNNGKKMVTRLREELKKSEFRIEMMKQDVKREMIMKFGVEVDLEKAIAADISLKLLDIRMEIEKSANEMYRERDKINAKIDSTKYSLVGKIKKNSEYNTLHAMLIERERDLDFFFRKTDSKTDERTFPTPRQTNAGRNVDEEICSLTRTLYDQEERIKFLQDTIRKCRIKSRLPPVIVCGEECQGENASNLLALRHVPGTCPEDEKNLNAYRMALEKQIERQIAKIPPKPYKMRPECQLPAPKNSKSEAEEEYNEFKSEFEDFLSKDEKGVLEFLAEEMPAEGLLLSETETSVLDDIGSQDGPMNSGLLDKLTEDTARDVPVPDGSIWFQTDGPSENKSNVPFETSGINQGDSKVTVTDITSQIMKSDSSNMSYDDQEDEPFRIRSTEDSSESVPETTA